MNKLVTFKHVCIKKKQVGYLLTTSQKLPIQYQRVQINQSVDKIKYDVWSNAIVFGSLTFEWL